MKAGIMSSLAAGYAIVTMSVGLPATPAAEPIEFRSNNTPTSLVELFTSEGCSSCPPAERWISGLRTNPKLWKDFVIVSFHVDYWDGLGWKDPFARREFTLRQQMHADQWRTASVYTPGFVVDGKEWRGWFNREALPEPPATKVGVLAARSEKPGAWELRYEGRNLKPERKLTFSGALLGFGLNSKVNAGENSGRTLDHDFVVLKLVTVSAEHAEQLFKGTLSLPLDAPLGSKQLGVAFWISSGTDLRPLQAVGGWLPK